MAQVPTTPGDMDNKQSMAALKQYGGYIIAAIVVVLASYFGWNYWKNHQAVVDTDAADEYADIQRLNDEVSLAAQNPDLSTEAKANLSSTQQTLNQKIDALVAQHHNTIYAWQALMIKARQQADANDFAGANDSLKQATEIELHDAGLKALTELRYAQSLLASGDDKTAFEVASKEMPQAFEASKQELLGDIYLVQNRKEDAIRAYHNAWDLLKKRQENRAVLILKLESLGEMVTPIEPKASLVAAPKAEQSEPLSSDGLEQLNQTQTDVDADAVDADVGANQAEEVLSK